MDDMDAIPLPEGFGGHDDVGGGGASGMDGDGAAFTSDRPAEVRTM